VPLSQPAAAEAGRAPDAASRPAVVLVLGAGGMAGLAFHAGVLVALAEGLGWDPRQVELVVGTSAGALTAAGLRAGLSAADLFARSCGEALSPEGAAILARAEAAAGAGGPPTPRRRVRPVPASPGVLLAAGRRPGRVRPGALLAGLLPAGRVPVTAIAEGVDALDGGRWPDLPTWICAVRLSSGELCVFGRPGAPPATLGQAVAASCAIPGYFAPQLIGGSRYVDGGAHSTTNLAEVAPVGPELVVVSAPMARAGSRPAWAGRLTGALGVAGVLGVVGRELNRWQLQVEARRVSAAGATVVAFSPTAADREVMGLNPMDPSRRAPIARQARASALRRLERVETQELLAPLAAGAP
jgi:NTE family protein